MLRIGQAALDTLATIPDTPELVEADRVFLAAHKLPLYREPHPIGAEMRGERDRLSAYLDRPGTLTRLDQRLAERAAAEDAASEPPIAGRYSTGAGNPPDIDLKDQVEGAG